jgi:uncharacterized protein (TIGR03435 family)
MTLRLLTFVALGQMALSFSGLQTTATRTFDVASIKVNTTGDPGWLLSPPRRGVEKIVNLELRKIIASSFRTQDKLILDGPSWLDTTRYNIDAKGPEDVSDVAVWEMMRSLLRERFHFKYHLETREMTVYSLSVDRNGHKLGDPSKGMCGERIKSGDGEECGAIRFPPYGVAIDNMPIGALTAVLARRLQDRPVVDDTGLKGRYDALVRWRPDDMTPDQLDALPADARPPDMAMFEAFERQAGLKLEVRKRPTRVVVVDQVEPADPN